MPALILATRRRPRHISHPFSFDRVCTGSRLRQAASSVHRQDFVLRVDNFDRGMPTEGEGSMAFLMKSSPRSAILPILWNVSAAVGAGGTNGLEDTWLVQYMLKMSAKSAHAMDAGMRAKLLALQVTGTCDLYTIDCIKAYQTYIKAKNASVTVDGRITSAPPSLKYGTAYYMIAMVNMTYRDRYWDNWPAICADSSYADSVITELVYREMFGTSPPQ